MARGRCVDVSGLRAGRLSLMLALVLGPGTLATLACGGSSPPKPASAALPDEPAPPPRVVPKASPLVKDGEAKLQAKDPKGAREAFEQAIAADPSDARAHLDLGIACELLDDAEAAEQAYRKAVELAPDLAEAHNNLGVLLRDRGELDEAVPLLTRATELNPRSAAAHGNLALALEDGGDAAGAEREYRAALGVEPENVMTRVNLGLLLVNAGQAEQGKAELRRALTGAEGNRAALVAIGNGLRRAGDAAGAAQAMQGAVDAGGDPTPALLTELALAQRATGDRDTAIATLERALAIDAKFAAAHYVLGNMLAGAKRMAEAKKHYEKYLALEPKGPQADEARERLRVLKSAK
jgi:Tfp pilus assembly protein PilF